MAQSTSPYLHPQAAPGPLLWYPSTDDSDLEQLKTFYGQGPWDGGWQEVPIQFQFPTREAIAPAQCGQKFANSDLRSPAGIPSPHPLP